MSGTAATTKRPRPPRDGVTAPATAPAAVYLPATADRPAEPAPWVLTAADVVRLLRIDTVNPFAVLKRFRAKGWIHGTKLGQAIQYRLPDVLRLIDRAHDDDAR